MQNKYDDKCFKWAITSAVYTKKSQPERLDKKMRKDAKSFDWTGIVFPTPLDKIDTFEKTKPGYEIWVFGWKDGKVYPIRPGGDDASKKKINLLYLKNEETSHFCWIKDIEKLCFSQAGKCKNKKHLCRRCLRFSHSNKSLDAHREIWMNNKKVTVVVVMVVWEGGGG